MARSHDHACSSAVFFGRNARMAGAAALAAGAAAMLLTPFASPRASAGPQQTPAPPVNGMRPVDLRTHAITNATVIPEPGKKVEKATIIVNDGVIEWVGPASEAKIPAGAQTWNGEGLTVYTGLIECALLVAANDLPPSPGAHWNSKVRAEIEMSTQPPPDRATRTELRNMGFTTAAVYPSSGAFRGSGTVLALADEDNQMRTYRDRAAMMMAFDYGFGRGGPPTTPATPTPATPNQRNPATPTTPTTPTVERGAGFSGGG